MNNREIGKLLWAFTGGEIPMTSTGKEPEFLSFDQLSILNTSETNAQLRMTFFFADKDPVGPYKIEVKAQRLRRFRINDLIDPQAIPYGVPYGGVIESNVPVVVQFTKQNTAQKELAIMGTIAYFEAPNND